MEHNAAQDFGGLDKYAIECACFLCDFRDAEIATLNQQTVPLLKTDARCLEIKFSSSIRKPQLVGKILSHRCDLAIKHQEAY